MSPPCGKFNFLTSLTTHEIEHWLKFCANKEDTAYLMFQNTCLEDKTDKPTFQRLRKLLCLKTLYESNYFSWPTATVAVPIPQIQNEHMWQICKDTAAVRAMYLERVLLLAGNSNFLLFMLTILYCHFWYKSVNVLHFLVFYVGRNVSVSNLGLA